MRILMLAQFYPPVIGGEERHVRNLSIELAARGRDVTVVTLWQEGAPEEEHDQGVHIYRVRASMQRLGILFSEKERMHSPPFPDPEVLLALRRILQKERPQIVHAHNWIVHSVLPLKTWSDARLVVTLHDYSLVCATKRLMYRNTMCTGPAFSRCLQCAQAHYGSVKGIPTMVATRCSEKLEHQAVDMFLPVSQAVAEGTQLARYGIRYKVIPNFIPDTLEEACDEEHPLLSQLPQEPFFLFVGDLSRDKGVEFLLEAYGELEHPIPLVLIGRPAHNYRPTIPSNVKVLERWPHAAIMGAWKRCTVALAPSLWPDPCPTVAMEAMVMGKPVIASSMGGLVDIVKDGETGLLVPPGNVPALRKAMQRLIDDTTHRSTMGMMARQSIRAFQATAVVSQIEQIYQELC